MKKAPPSGAFFVWATGFGLRGWARSIGAARQPTNEATAWDCLNDGLDEACPVARSP